MTRNSQLSTTKPKKKKKQKQTKQTTRTGTDSQTYMGQPSPCPLLDQNDEKWGDEDN